MTSTAENVAVKQWLEDNPYDPADASTLPTGWEIRFGIRGRFLKYDSVEHAEKKNMSAIRETSQSLAFGYANAGWTELKGNLEEGDEIWRVGTNDGEVIYIVRDGKLVTQTYGNHTHPKRGFYLVLSTY